MPITPIETGYKPEFALGALYQGINAANAEQASQEDLIKQFLANQREQQMQPLDIQAAQLGIPVKQLAANQAEAMNNPEGINAWKQGHLGELQSKAAQGQISQAELPGKLTSAGNSSLFANMQKTALDPNASPEEKQAAITKLGDMASVLGITPGNLFEISKEQMKQQGKQLTPSNLVGIMRYALDSGMAPSDAVKIYEALKANLPQQQGTVGFPFAQQAPAPITPKQEAPKMPDQYTLSMSGLNDEDTATVNNLLAIAQSDPKQAKQINDELRLIANKYQQQPAQPAAVENKPLIDQEFTRYSEKRPKPSKDTPEQFTSQDGTVYTPKNSKEKAMFEGLASDYITPGQIAIGRNNAIITSANELSASLKNLSILTDKGESYGSSGAWSGLKNDTLFGAAASNALKPLTQRETLQTEALMKPIARMVSTMMYGGQGGTQADREKMEQAIMQPFGTKDRVVALQKMGELRQMVTAAMEAQSANQTLSRPQREKLLKSYRSVVEALPFKAEDVLLWQKSGMKEPFRTYMDKQLSVQKYLQD